MKMVRGILGCAMTMPRRPPITEVAITEDWQGAWLRDGTEATAINTELQMMKKGGTPTEELTTPTHTLREVSFVHPQSSGLFGSCAMVFMLYYHAACQNQKQNVLGI